MISTVTKRKRAPYAEYTYTIKDKLSVVAGIRGDYNAYYDRFFATPRGHLKWNITPSTTLRASAGLGYRSTNVITDNIGVLATGRKIVFLGSEPGAVDFKRFDRMEKALTVGGSLTQTFSLAGSDNATLSFDYFRTQFYNSVVADQEYDRRRSSYTTPTGVRSQTLIRSTSRGRPSSGSTSSPRSATRTAK